MSNKSSQPEREHECIKRIFAAEVTHRHICSHSFIGLWGGAITLALSMKDFTEETLNELTGALRKRLQIQQIEFLTLYD